jgi:HAD superfamily hydrolase (TIGR01509 family)
VRFKAVLFDMDGVVADTMPLHREVWRRFAASHGVPRTLEELRPLDGRRAGDIVELLLGERDPDRVKALAEAREALYRDLLSTATVEAVAGVRELLAWLGERRIPRVLATSATPENVEQVLGPLGLRGAFEGVVTSVDVSRGKPDPEVYLLAAARAGVAPGDCLVIEDALPGVEAACAAGATCLGLTTSLAEGPLREAGARWVVPDLRVATVQGLLGVGAPEAAGAP